MESEFEEQEYAPMECRYKSYSGQLSWSRELEKELSILGYSRLYVKEENGAHKVMMVFEDDATYECGWSLSELDEGAEDYFAVYTNKRFDHKSAGFLGYVEAKRKRRVHMGFFCYFFDFVSSDGKSNLIMSHKFSDTILQISLEKEKVVRTTTLQETDSSIDIRTVREILMDGVVVPELRSYQMRIVSSLHECVENKQNGLIVLPTGSGKTRIFCELLKKDVKIFIAVPTIVLVTQTLDVVRKYCKSADIKKKIIGATGMEKRESCDIFIGTPVAVLANHVDEAGILIVDECHHCIGGSVILSVVEQAHRNKVLVYGFTASAGFSFDLGVLEMEYRELKRSLRVTRVFTLSKEETAEFEEMRFEKETSKEFSLYQERMNFGKGEFINMLRRGQGSYISKQLWKRLSTLLDYVEGDLKVSRDIRSELTTESMKENINSALSILSSVWSHGIEDLGSIESCLYPAIAFVKDREADPMSWKKVMYALCVYEMMITLESLKMQEINGQQHGELALTHLNNYSKMRTFESQLHDTVLEKMLIEERHPCGEEDGTLERLDSCILNNSEKNKILIFAHNKLTVKALHTWLRDTAILADYQLFWATGASGKLGVRAAMTKRELERTMEEVRSSDRYILIASAVLEEGIDVPSMSVVIRFDEPNTLKSYIQAKGRCRSAEGDVFGIAETNRYFHNKAELAESYLKALIRAEQDEQLRGEAEEIKKAANMTLNKDVSLWAPTFSPTSSEKPKMAKRKPFDARVSWDTLNHLVQTRDIKYNLEESHYGPPNQKTFLCKLIINNVMTFNGRGSTKKAARDAALKEAYERDLFNVL